MAFDIPTYEERKQHRADTTLRKWVEPMNVAIYNGDWNHSEIMGFPYIHVSTDGKWIEETHWQELEAAYKEAGWIIEQHSIEINSTEERWHIQIYRMKVPEA